MAKQPLRLRVVVSDSSSAIKFAGGEGECGKLSLDFYPKDAAQLLQILALRGKEWDTDWLEVK